MTSSSLNGNSETETKTNGFSKPQPSGKLSPSGTSYPVDGKFKSAEERDHIMSLPEVQKEQLLAERAVEVEREEQNRHLRALLDIGASGDKDEASERKRKAEQEPEDDRRKSTRIRTTLGGRVEGESNPVLEKYRRVREKKASEQKNRTKAEHHSPAPRRRRSSESSSLSSRSAGQISDYDSPNRVTKPSIKAQSQQSQIESPERLRPAAPVQDMKRPADLAEINRIKVGRNNLGIICFTPGFEEKIKDCFGRIVINPHTNAYAAVRLQSFSEDLSKPFMLSAKVGEFRCGIYASVHGAPPHLKEVALCLFSTGKITPQEWDAYKALCAKERIPMPTIGHVQTKIAQINSLINYKFTDNEVLARLRRMGRGDDNAMIVRRADLKRERNAAVASKDEAKIAECDRKILELEGPKLRYAAAPAKVNNSSTKPKKETYDEKLAKATEHARAANRAAKLEREKMENERKKAMREHLKRVAEAKKEGATPDQISRTGTPSLDHGRPTKILSEKQREKLKEAEELKERDRMIKEDRKKDVLDYLEPEIAAKIRKERDERVAIGGLRSLRRPWEIEALAAASLLKCNIDDDLGA